jgi:hypothetical protein
MLKFPELKNQDDNTGHCLSYFLKDKMDLADSMYDWLRLVKKEITLDVKCIHLENTGEIEIFINSFKKLNSNKFVLPAPVTPQQKGKVERAFATFYGKS